MNAEGSKAMLGRGKGHFPVGSIVVKEKLPSLDGQPELLTVMVKRPAGFDPKHGDWQYFTADGTGTKTSQENVKSCQECHEMNKQNDYVFRSYVEGAAQPKRRW